MNAESVGVPPARGVSDLANHAAGAMGRYLDSCGFAVNTVRAYKGQVAAYVQWVTANEANHSAAFSDVGGAEAAVASWRAYLVESGTAPSSINQALIAATLLYERGAGLRIQVERVPRKQPADVHPLSLMQQRNVDRASVRSGVRNAAIVAVLLYAGATPEECVRLRVEDLSLVDAAASVHLRRKDGHVRVVPLPDIARERLAAWVACCERPGPLWIGPGGMPMTVAGITRVVVLTGEAAGIPGLRPFRLRHTCGVRLREDGADVSLVRERLGLQSTKAASRYFSRSRGRARS
ncbi:tyrosine-type recombinase/integrase [Amycolatopsis sp. NBC_01480]|uniref:tyrosine-type recombinase/integrase n=1 Tax=Amycolatopsis sp. NBC_01480 TaxID=2903562 RepID=UPI002E2B0056|nr:tyrosine-type recombinase/integrase [Amycolatopsis sp. NBC_01480]